MNNLLKFFLSFLMIAFVACEKPDTEPAQTADQQNQEQVVPGDGDNSDNAGDVGGEPNTSTENNETGDPGDDNQGENPGDDNQGENPSDDNQGENPDDNQGENPGEPENPSDPNPGSSEEPSDYTFLSSGAPSSLSDADRDKLAALNGFAFRFAALADKKAAQGSYVVSPTSLIYLLGLLSEGAAGTTRSEILGMLGFSGNQQALNEFCRNLIVLSRASATGEEALELANALVLNKDFPLRESYRETVKNYYDAYSCNKDFSQENVAEFVNAWASRHTHERITKVLDDVPSSTMAVLMNALYFKARWALAFDDYFTKEEKFTSASGETRKEQMMHRKDMYSRILYSKGNDYDAVKLAYGDPWLESPGNYAMTVILPSEGVSSEEFLSGLSGNKWAAMQSSFSGEYVDLKLPRFEADFDETLNEILKTLGAESMFSTANFSNMSDIPVFVNLIKQVANITVNEVGTEAAAVSVATMEASSPGPPETPRFVEFYANRPFIFAITEQSTGAILFLGCYR